MMMLSGKTRCPDDYSDLDVDVNCAFDPDESEDGDDSDDVNTADLGDE